MSAVLFGVLTQAVRGIVTLPSKSTFVLCGVYASTIDDKRAELWRAWVLFAPDSSGLPTIVMGDFNALLEASEKSSGILREDRVNLNFREFVNTNSLIDMGFWPSVYMVQCAASASSKVGKV